jgi:hypothetical protein
VLVLLLVRVLENVADYLLFNLEHEQEHEIVHSNSLFKTKTSAGFKARTGRERESTPSPSEHLGGNALGPPKAQT